MKAIFWILLIVVALFIVAGILEQYDYFGYQFDWKWLAIVAAALAGPWKLLRSAIKDKKMQKANQETQTSQTSQIGIVDQNNLMARQKNAGGASSGSDISIEDSITAIKSELASLNNQKKTIVSSGDFRSGDPQAAG